MFRSLFIFILENIVSAKSNQLECSGAIKKIMMSFSILFEQRFRKKQYCASATRKIILARIRKEQMIPMTVC